MCMGRWCVVCGVWFVTALLRMLQHPPHNIFPSLSLCVMSYNVPVMAIAAICARSAPVIATQQP